MVRKICISAAAIFFTMQFLAACCNCEDVPVLRADWSGLRLTQGYYTLDSATVTPQIDPGRNFTDRNLVVYLEPEIQLLATHSNHFGAFANCAYACKCDDVQTYQMRRKVTRITVRNLFPFDSRHPAGSDITAYFKIADPFMHLSDRPLPLPEDLYTGFWSLALYLANQPAAAGPQQFEVSFDLSDGAAVRDTTVVFQF